jgi:hypothetical protein
MLLVYEFPCVYPLLSRSSTGLWRHARWLCIRGTPTRNAKNTQQVLLPFFVYVILVCLACIPGRWHSLALKVLSFTDEPRGIRASKTRVAFRVIDSEHFGEGRMMNASSSDEYRARSAIRPRR